MFANEISIEIRNSDADPIKMLSEFEGFFSIAWKNGQLEDAAPTIFQIDNRLVGYAFSLEKTSMAKKYDNKYMKQQRRALETGCGGKLQFKIVGVNESEQHVRVCSCKKPKSYVLYTDSLKSDSPVRCGDCGGSVPLYRIPYDDADWPEHFSIRKWDSVYCACDRLDLHCGFAEKWAIRQKSDPASGLMKDARETADSIEKVTGVPVYIYLYNFKMISLEKDRQRKCPQCGGDWLLEEPWFNDRLHFRCDKCKLTSNLTFEHSDDWMPE